VGGKRGGDRWTLKVMVSSCTHSLRRRSSKLRPKRPLVLPLAPEASAEPSPDPLSTSGPTTQHLHVTGGEISCRDQRLRAGIGAPPQPSLRRPQAAWALLSDPDGSPELLGGNLERWVAVWAAASEGVCDRAAAPRRLAKRDRLDGEAPRRSERHELAVRISHREGYVQVGPIVPSLAHQRQRAAGVRLDELESVGARL
jgi:hypothetical protein